MSLQFFEHGGFASPFRLRRRIGPRPAFPGADAMAKVVGTVPFVEPERKPEKFETP